MFNLPLPVAVPIETLPFCWITNRVTPDEEAVKISPFPELSIIRPAKEVLAAMVATGAVPMLFWNEMPPEDVSVPAILSELEKFDASLTCNPPINSPLPAVIDPPILPILRLPDADAPR